MTKKKSVKGWVVLEKSKYFDWYVVSIFSLDNLIGPGSDKDAAIQYITDINTESPGSFEHKLKPCVITF